MSAKKRKKFNIGRFLLRLLFLLLAAFCLYLVFQARIAQEAIATATPEPTPAPTPAPEVIVAPTTPAPTPEPTPEPQPEYFRLSFLGDNTYWTNPNFLYSEYGFPLKIGEDYAYPFRNTAKYFAEDEYTLANLECTFSDTRLQAAGETFSFLAPAAFANILTEGHVDFVTMANNHTMDYFEAGRNNTIAALDAVGIPHGNEDEHQIVTTPSGLKLGIYTGYNTYHPEDKWSSIESAVNEMRADGADIIIVMFHWGQELIYPQNDFQTNLAHKCIDAGVDIVYGTHPHRLQPIEIYNGKLIMYSMGNWVFGGSTEPKDPDTAICQAIIKRDVDGTVSYSGYELIPCAITSNIDGANAIANGGYCASYNDYCPTPYEKGSDGYERTMAKLLGEGKVNSTGADYSNYYASLGG